MSLIVSKLTKLIADSLAGDWRVNYGHRLQAKRVLEALDKAGYEITVKETKNNEIKKESK